MAAKIPVVLSQAPSASSAARHLEEELVTLLLLEDRVEVNVIPHLEYLQQDDTGLLCLEGMMGDFLLLGWLAEQPARAQLKELGISGRPGRTRWSDATLAGGESATRSIYYIPLTSRTVAELRAEVARIRQDATMRTLDILDLGGQRLTPTSSSGAPPAKADASPHAPSHAPSHQYDSAAGSRPAPSASVQAAGKGPRTGSTSPGSHPTEPNLSKPNGSRPTVAKPTVSELNADELSDEQDAELERLVDELDQLDL